MGHEVSHIRNYDIKSTASIIDVATHRFAIVQLI
ncbi:Uncharacterised protein [Streptococcus pneumoniae]|nr:Uncharacterised protein [Streptococcus pneumoniae]